MEHLVKFNMLVMQLNHSEFIQFVTSVIERDGRHFILDLFLTKFKSTEEQQKQSFIAPFTELICNLMTSRSSDSDDTATNCSETSPPPPTLVSLPSALIAETASYLKAAEYITLSQCCRKLYVSCHMPCRIHHIPTCLLKRYPAQMSMAKFRGLRQLGLNVRHFITKVSSANQATWHNGALHTLQLSNRSGNECDVDIFLQRKLITHTANLKLHKFGTDDLHLYDAPSFARLLCTFPMITHLLLWDVYLAADDEIYNCENVRTWLPCLKGYGFTGGGSNQRLSECIIGALSHKLEALRIEGMHANNIACKKFPKLEELSLSMCNMEILHTFKHTDRLNAVMISSSKEDIIEQFIQIMVAKPCMKHMHIKSPAKLLKFAMEQMERKLFEFQHVERSSRALQIIFDGNNWDISLRFKDLHFSIYRLLNTLEKAKFSDFILRVKITSKQPKQIREEEDIKKWLEKLQGWRQSYLVHHEFNSKKSKHHEFIFTISNQGCKVSGYRYCWKMWSSSL